MANKTIRGCVRTPCPDVFCRYDDWIKNLCGLRSLVHPFSNCVDRQGLEVSTIWIDVICRNVHFPIASILLHHHKHCKDPGCPVCIPVKNYLQAQLRARTRPGSDSSSPNPIDGSYKSHYTVETTRLTSKAFSVVETSKELQPSSKRMKTEQPSRSLLPESESFAVWAHWCMAIAGCIQNDHHGARDKQNGASSILNFIKITIMQHDWKDFGWF